MIWNCPRCNEELGELNGWCEYCYCKDKTIVYNPDKYFVREIRIMYITSERVEREKMTPQEELFKELFNHEKLLVKDMDTLTLRAYREELCKTAFEARVKLSAVDDEEQERKKEKRKADGKPTGFERSLNIDETTTQAINVVKERQKKLTGKEKIKQGLIDLYRKGGASQLEAEKIADKAMGAGTILERVKDEESRKIIKDDAGVRSPLSQDDGFTIKGYKKPEDVKKEESKPIFNPFEKKS